MFEYKVFIPILYCFLSCLGQFLFWKQKTENVKEKATNCFLKTAFSCAYLSFIIIKVQELQIIFRTTQTLSVLIYFKKKFCLMSGLKFTLSGVTSFLPDNLSGLEIITFRSEAIIWVKWNQLMQMIFTNHWRIYKSRYRKLVWVGFESSSNIYIYIEDF